MFQNVEEGENLQCCFDSDSSYQNGIGSYIKKKVKGLKTDAKNIGKGVKRVVGNKSVKAVSNVVADNIRAGAKDGVITSENMPSAGYSGGQSEKPKKSKVILYAGIGAALLAVIATIVIVVKRKKK